MTTRISTCGFSYLAAFLMIICEFHVLIFLNIRLMAFFKANQQSLDYMSFFGLPLKEEFL